MFLKCEEMMGIFVSNRDLIYNIHCMINYTADVYNIKNHESNHCQKLY